ncbi:hypothetical protein SLE2022_161850 [Rubroshorea leprosula]
MSHNKDTFAMADLDAALKVEDEANFTNFMTPNVMKRVEVLRQIQNEHDELEAKFFEEKAALQAKYQKLYQPLYAKRYNIVNGIVEVEGISKETSKEPEPDTEKGVPSFWLMALRNNEVLVEVIREHDELVLQYLKDIKWCSINEPKGFKLEFFFNPNPYFKNTVLTKTYHMIDEEEPILESAIGTEIDWYPGKSLTQKTLNILKNESKNTKPLTKAEDGQSFFNFFDPPQVPDVEEIDEEAFLEQAEELQDILEQDYDIGLIIRDKIIPHAVSWFTGEAMEGDEDSEEDEDDGIYEIEDYVKDSDEEKTDHDDKNKKSERAQVKEVQAAE